jgi:hypothetical protein
MEFSSGCGSIIRSKSSLYSESAAALRTEEPGFDFWMADIYLLHTLQIRSRDSVVGIATGYGLDD